jgi:hypothetical protein
LSRGLVHPRGQEYGEVGLHHCPMWNELPREIPEKNIQIPLSIIHVGTIAIKPVDDALDGQVRFPVVFKCRSLYIGFLSFEPPRVSILPNLNMPSLNILINSPRLLHTFSAYLQAVFLDGLQSRAIAPSSYCKIMEYGIDIIMKNESKTIIEMVKV